MVRKKREPLAAREADAVKAFNRWLGSRCLIAPSDIQGSPHTTKNLGDIIDQYLFENQHVPYEQNEFLTLVRRYRAQKAADTKQKRKKAKLRKLSARLGAIGEALAKRRREFKQEKKRELASRQHVFDFI